MKSASEVYF